MNWGDEKKSLIFSVMGKMVHKYIFIMGILILFILIIFIPTSVKSQDAQSASPSATTQAPQVSDIDKQMEALTAKIKELEDKADQMLSQDQQEEKKKIRQEIKNLKGQLKLLIFQKNAASRLALNSQIDSIRNKYKDQLQSLEAVRDESRRKAIVEYESLLSRNITTSIAPDVKDRLALLYFEEAHSLYLRQYDRYEENLNMLIKQGVTGADVTEPRHDYSRSINLYQEVIDKYPTYPKRDGVLYMLAYCYGEINDSDKALQVYQKLIDESPKSKYSPEAYVRMGEIFFDNNQMDKAIERYSHLLSFPESKFYDKALYKLGWSYYKSNNIPKAVEFFTKVLEYYESRPQRRFRGGDDLRKESLDYIAISFAEQEDTDGTVQAKAFIKQLKNPKWGEDILYKMGEVFLDRTDYAKARNAYRSILEMDPYNPKSPDIYLKIIDSFEKESDWEGMIAESERLSDLYGPNSEWSRRNASNQIALEKAKKIRQSGIYASATFHHVNANKAREKDQKDVAQKEFAAALESYQKFLKEFPDSPDKYETIWGLAECYYYTDKYNEAADNYKKVAENKDGKYYKDALFNVYKAYEEQLKIEGGLPNKLEEAKESASEEEGKGAKKEIVKKPLSPTAQNLVAALRTHIAAFPNDEATPKMIYKIGEIYYGFGQFAEARVEFEKVVDNYPQHEASQTAAHYLIESYKIDGDFAGLKVASEKLLSKGTFTQEGKERDKLVELKSGAAGKIAEQDMKEGKYAEGITEYIKMYEENPKSRSGAIALHNAGLAYENKLNKIYEANQLYERLATEIPDDELAPQDLLHAGYNYEKLADFPKAVGVYEKFISFYPNNEKTNDAIYNAGLLKEITSDYSGAISNYHQYLSRAGDAPDAQELALSIAKIYEEQGDTTSAMGAYNDFCSKYKDAEMLSEAYFKWGKILYTQGNYDEANKRFAQSIAVYKMGSSMGQIESKYASEAKILMTQPSYDRYKTVRYTGDQKQDAKLMVQKGDMFRELKADYEDVVGMGNLDWALAALYMLGMINKEFADALFQAPQPKDLKPEEQDEYTVKLEDMAFPIKSRAIEAFKTCIDQAATKGVWNEWVEKATDEYKIIKPDAPAPLKFEIYATTPGVSIAIPDFVFQKSKQPLPTPEAPVQPETQQQPAAPPEETAPQEPAPSGSQYSPQTEVRP